MKKFIVNLFSNRLGILLATLNVCYFASKVHNFKPLPLDTLFFCANFPAGIFTLVVSEFIKIFAADLTSQAKLFLVGIFGLVFVVFQWLFIAWFAKTIATKVQKINQQ